MMPKVWMGVVLLMAVALACQPGAESDEATPGSSTDEYAPIYETMDRIAETWSAGDLQAGSMFFAEEFTQMPPGETARVGLDAVNAVWAEFLEANTDLWEPAISEVRIVEELAFARGTTRDTVTPKAGGEPLTSESNALWIFRRQADGSWKLIFEHWLPKGAARALVEVAPPTLVASPEETAVIYRTMESIAATFNAGDIEGSLVFFAEEFAQMPPGEEGLIGLDAIADVWREFVAENTARWEPTVTDVQIVGDFAYARGSATETSTPRAGGETTAGASDSLWVFQRQADGSWKMIFEYWLPLEETGVE